MLVVSWGHGYHGSYGAKLGTGLYVSKRHAAGCELAAIECEQAAIECEQAAIECEQAAIECEQAAIECEQAAIECEQAAIELRASEAWYGRQDSC